MIRHEQPQVQRQYGERAQRHILSPTFPACNVPSGTNTPLYSKIHQGHASAVTALVQAGALPQASDGEWWTTLLVGAVTGDEAALTELIAASEELTRRMDENGHYARTAVQLAELCTHHLPARRQEVLAALAAAQP